MTSLTSSFAIPAANFARGIRFHETVLGVTLNREGNRAGLYSLP